MYAPVPPVPLDMRGPVSALVVDAPRRRIFAAGAQSVAVIDAGTGKVRALLHVPGVRSLAVEPLGGHVFAGTQDGRISELDPDRATVVRTVATGAPAEALFDDAETGRLYVRSDRPGLAVVDTRSFTRAGDVPLGGRVPAHLTPDPVTREFYVTFVSGDPVAVIDPQSGTQRVTFPAAVSGGIVRLDDVFGQLVIVGSRGTLDVYDRAGTHRWSVAVPAGIAACDLDAADHVLACTGAAGITIVQLARDRQPSVVRTDALSATALVAFDSNTNDAVVVHAAADGRVLVLERRTAAN